MHTSTNLKSSFYDIQWRYSLFKKGVMVQVPNKSSLVSSSQMSFKPVLVDPERRSRTPEKFCYGSQAPSQEPVSRKLNEITL